MLCDVGLGCVVLCCVTDEVWTVRQNSALDEEERGLYTVVRVFTVSGRVDVWTSV
jgi:hypothetical protein